MAQPLYFIEGVDTISPAEIEALGLGYALVPGFSLRQAGNGPGGTGGVVASLSVERIGFFPDDQQWRRTALATAGGGVIWFGWRQDSPPTPADLLRPTAVSGETIQLFDDQAWAIPRAIARVNGGMRLVSPASAKFEGGKWMRGTVKAAYRRLEELGREFWDRWMMPIDDPARALTATDIYGLAVEALGINYRVSALEASELGLFDDQLDTPLAVLKAVVDYAGFVEHQEFGGSPEKKSG